MKRLLCLLLAGTLLASLHAWAQSPQRLTGVAGKSVGSSNVAPDFSLRTNYPNPFNRRTNIAFMVPRTGDTAVRVLSMLGQKVVYAK